MKMSIAVVLILPSFLIGIILGWYAQSRRAEKRIASIVVADKVGEAGLFADALKIMEEGKTAKLQKLFEWQMTRALDYAAKRVSDASPVGFPVPNLVEGLNRARRYATAKSMPEVIRECDRLLEYLKGNVRA